MPRAESAPAARGRTPSPRRRLWRSVRANAPSFALAIGLAIVLRSFVVEAVVIPSGSMIPTLEVGDRLFIDKSVYGLKLPGVTRKLTAGRAARRGEVVVFVPVSGRGADLIKRVVAVGGDRVELRANQLLVNDRPVPRRRLPGPCVLAAEGEAPAERCTAFEESQDGVRYRVLQREVSPTDFGPLLVPRGHVFVLGDSRDNSHDSRFWGTVPHAHLKGRAFVVWYPGGPPGERLARLFHSVHTTP